MNPPDALCLDVRPVLASGQEPFDLIMTAAGQVPSGGALEVIAPFEPLPLYGVMRRRGFAWHTESRGPDEWRVTFRDTGIGAGQTLADVVAQAPATREVFLRHGLDLCCGGGKTIGFAAQAHGVELDGLLEELHAVVAA